MRVLPVIDLKDGLVVRGVAGQRSQYREVRSVLTKDSSPRGIARVFATRLKARQIYVADLDAIAGETPRLDIYRELAAAGPRLWVDAGVSDAERAQLLLGHEEMIARLILGLESVPSPTQLEQLIKLVGPERCVFSLDLHSGQPLNQAPDWRELTPLQIAERAVDAGVASIIVLDLASVGVGQGPAVIALCRALKDRWPQLELVAGGGVRHVQDLRALHDAGCSAALVASALHSGALTVLDVVAAANWKSNPEIESEFPYD